VERVRSVAIAVSLLFLACPAATPETVVVGSQYLRSSPIVELTVMRRAEAVKGVPVVFYRYDRSDEIQFWVGATGANGRLLPPRLSPGRYRISADAGKRSATLYLDVTKEEKPVTRFEMRLVRQDGLDGAEDAPTAAWIEDFRGAVFDQSGALVPQTQIEIFRRDDVDGGPLLQMRSDENGGFAAHLDSGTYLAAFRAPGFKTRVLAFEVTAKGETELRITLEVGSVG
jgi:hypothetical protein